LPFVHLLFSHHPFSTKWEYSSFVSGPGVQGPHQFDTLKEKKQKQIRFVFLFVAENEKIKSCFSRCFELSCRHHRVRWLPVHPCPRVCESRQAARQVRCSPHPQGLLCSSQFRLRFEGSIFFLTSARRRRRKKTAQSKRAREGKTQQNQLSNAKNGKRHNSISAWEKAV